MKAYVLHAVNDFRYDEVDIPDCPKDWALVKVKAAGICSSDIARVFTKGTYHFPTIPGHEIAGVVEKVNGACYNNLLGRKVAVFPLIPCRSCSQCEEKHFEMCENYDYVGSRRDGGFAEYVAVPIWNLVLLEDSIPFTHAAMMEPLAVGLHAAKLANIKKGDTVGIIGTGMIGICAAQWAIKLGASSVTVIGRNLQKKTIVEKCGLNYIMSSANSVGYYDVVIEAVGTPDAIEMAINAANPGGCVLLMGNPSGDISLNQSTYWRILRKQLSLKGTWNSSYDSTNPSDWTEAAVALADNSIKVDSLISHCFDQQHVQKGFALMYRHEEPYCKVMTVWNE